MADKFALVGRIGPNGILIPEPWNPGDTLKDQDGNPIGNGATFSQLYTASTVIVTASTLVTLLSINTLPDAIKWLRVMPLAETNFAGSPYFSMSGEWWIKTDVNPFLITGARCASTGATIPVQNLNGAVLANGQMLVQQTGLGTGNYIRVNNLNFNPGTKRIDFEAKGCGSGNDGFAIMVESYA